MGRGAIGSESRLGFEAELEEAFASAPGGDLASDLAFGRVSSGDPASGGDLELELDSDWDSEPVYTCHCPYCGAPLVDRFAYSEHLIQGCGAPQK